MPPLQLEANGKKYDGSRQAVGSATGSSYMIFKLSPDGKILKAIPLDAWGRAYRYSVTGKEGTLWSIGPNGIDEKGEGDDAVESRWNLGGVSVASQ